MAKNDFIEYKYEISNLSLKKAEEGDNFLGYVKGFAATDHLDRHDEIITSEALSKGASSLKKNSTVFLNHDYNKLPVGKVVESQFVNKSDFSGIEIKVGVSKTADRIWTLIEEGILTSFSIGGRLLDYEIKEMEKGTYVGLIKDMDIVEVSLVGIPANPNAKFVTSKSFVKSLTKALEPKLKEHEENIKEIEKSQEIDKEIKEEMPDENINELKDLITGLANSVKGLVEKSVETDEVIKKLNESRSKAVINDSFGLQDKVFSSKEEEIEYHKELIGKLLISREDSIIRLDGIGTNNDW